MTNLKKMCTARGYTVLNASDKEVMTDQCTIIYSGNVKVNTNYIKDITKLMDAQNIDHVILVHSGAITINAKSIIDIQSIYQIELFDESFFCHDLMSHELVPKHEKVTNPFELKTLAKERSNLAHIDRGDPVCMYYGFKPRDIIGITRKNGIRVFRIVV